MADEKTCPHCGKPVPPTALGGICPECMLKAGLAAQTEGPDGTGPHGTKVVHPPPSPAEIAALFPQLEILECLGRGGMGVVYKARQPRLNRLVALKILARDKEQDVQFTERFAREAQALARLNHPNIVTVHDFGEAGGHCYLVMEFVDGPNLRQLLQTGKMKPEQALVIVPKICEALQYAHEQGIVHRDIKPENILLDKSGRVKIADFGIAKMMGDETGQQTLTGAKDAVGTPHYMAPEQIEKPLTVDHRADIYSLGVVFYEMLTGELPLGKFQPPSQKVQVDVRLDEVILRALEKEPERRYQQVSEVKTRVETIANTSAPPAASAVSAGEILARDYTLNIRNCVRRGWVLVRNDFWPLVGMSAFVIVVLSAASSVELVFSSGNSSGNPSGKTSVLGLLLGGPLMGGLYLYFLKKIRREVAGVETAFTGFRQPFPHLVIAGFLATVLTVLGFLCLILPGVYLFVAWIFTFPLIVDKRLDFWPAMQLSRKIISKHWWKFFGFLIVLALINLAGIAAFCLGLFITFPITFAALAYAYEDIAGAVKSPAGASSSIPPIAPTTSSVPRPDRFWRFIVVVFVVIPTLALLVSIALQNFIKPHHDARPPAKSFYIGQAWFPNGDSIEITSVERSPERMVVKGHYNLVSADSALLVLNITTTTNTAVPTDAKQQMQISKGRGDFELIHSHIVPGSTHVSMYADGKSFATLYFTVKSGEATSVVDQIEDAFAGLGGLKGMPSGRQYELNVGGKKAMGEGDDFLRRRTGAEILDSGLSSGCGDYAIAFIHLMQKRGLETLFVDSAEVSLSSLESHFSGHAVVAVRDPVNERWLLADPTDKRIITNNWSTSDKTFYGDRFWIGYCGPLDKYPAHAPDELKEFYANTLKKVPSDFWNQHIFKFDFKIDPSLIGPDGKYLAPNISKLEENQNNALTKFNIQPGTEIDVLLVKGDDDTYGTLTYSDERGWVCTVGLKSECSLSFVTYMQNVVASVAREKIHYKLVQNPVINKYASQAFPTNGANFAVASNTVAPLSDQWQFQATNAANQTANQAVIASAQTWLGSIDDGKYSESWNEASAIVQGAASEQSFANAMETFRKPLGALVSRKLKSAQPMTELPGAPDGRYVLMQFETSFTNKKSAIETVTFMLEKNGQWKSAGYFIK